LIIIIALGESLIVAASAISAQERSQDLIMVGGLAVIVTCLLWWSYFAWIHEHLEEYFSRKSGGEQARLARDAFSFIHFPLICGIIGIAIGFEKILHHPHDLLSIPVACALGGGYVLFIGFTAASVWRSSNLILLPRLIILILSIVGVALSVGQPPQLALSIISASLVLLIFIEWKKCRHG
jgi:low temperature requirement protein LtrA